MAVHYMLGGKGDMTGALEYFGGAYDPAITNWNAAQGDNGTFLSQIPSDGNITDNGGKVRVHGASGGEFTNSIEGVYAYLISGSHVNGRYKVTGIDSADGNYVDLGELTWAGNDGGVYCAVGGAIGDDANNDDWDTFQIATDLAVAGDRVRVRNIMTFTSASDINIDGNDGTSIEHIRVLAVDIDGARDLSTKVVLSMSGTPGVPIIHLSNNVRYWDFLGFDFNGNSNSSYVLESAGTETYNSFYSCIFRDAITNSDIIRFAGDYLYMYDCEVTGATGGTSVHGINNKSQYAIYDSCYIHDNTGHGINASGIGSSYHRIFDCRIIANEIGINSTGANLIVINCTIANNRSHGIYQSVGGWTLTHCNITGNGGYGIHTNGLGPRATVFQYNNAGTGGSANASGAIDVGVWSKMGQGGNLALDPMYDANFFTRNINLIQGGIDKRPIGPRHRVWIPPSSRGAA